MKLPISFVAQPPPIHTDDDGVLRVRGTRVRVETLINAFKNGSAWAEELHVMARLAEPPGPVWGTPHTSMANAGGPMSSESMS